MDADEFAHAPGSGSLAAGNRLGWPGNSCHRIGKIALFDRIIFHAGSNHIVGMTGSSAPSSLRSRPVACDS